MAVISRLEQLNNDLSMMDAGSLEYEAKVREIIHELGRHGVNDKSRYEDTFNSIVGFGSCPDVLRVEKEEPVVEKPKAKKKAVKRAKKKTTKK